MRPELYAANTTTQTLATGETINPGAVIKRSGCNCTLQGDSILIDTQHDYEISASITGTATAAGTITVTAYKDGTAIPGATASATLGAGETAALPIMGLSRRNCCCCCYDDTAVITFIWAGAAGTVTNIATRVTSL